MSHVGRFGRFGGQYVPETVMNAVHELEEAYDRYREDPDFWQSCISFTETMPTVLLCCTMPKR